MNKWSVVYPHIRVLFCNNKHQVAGTCYKQMEKSLILSKRSQTQGNMVQGFIYGKCPEWINL